MDLKDIIRSLAIWCVYHIFVK